MFKEAKSKLQQAWKFIKVVRETKSYLTCEICFNKGYPFEFSVFIK